MKFINGYSIFHATIRYSVLKYDIAIYELHSEMAIRKILFWRNTTIMLYLISIIRS